MAQETIVFTQGGELSQNIRELGQQMKPAGFTLHTLPGGASAADIAAAMREAEYLMGFVRFLPDAAYTQATRLKLVQVLSIMHGRRNICSTGTARQRMQRKICRFHLLPQIDNIRRQLPTLGKDNRFLCHDALRTIPALNGVP